MSEEDLELLITLDDPEGAPEEDTFHHLPAENSVEYVEFGLPRASGGLQS